VPGQRFRLPMPNCGNLRVRNTPAVDRYHSR
jgi:hypothetical protein